MIEAKFIEHIAAELKVAPEQVAAAVPLFNKGATVPFVARYRKDVTGNLDEALLERVEERNAYFTALTNRRDAALENIANQGKLTDALRERLLATVDQTELEALYLPFKKQPRTKANVACEQGLEPLASFLWNQQLANLPIEAFAEEFVRPEKSVSSPEEALLGAHNILVERLSMDVDVRAQVRKQLLENGEMRSTVTKNAQDQKTKFEAYYDYKESLKEIPSHRLLAVLRGARMGILRMDLTTDDAQVMADLLEGILKEPGSPFEVYLKLAVDEAYKRVLRPALESEVVGIVRRSADEEAVRVFRENARNLLLAPPAGPIPVIGIVPSRRSGHKIAVIDAKGGFLESMVIAAEESAEGEEAAAQTLMDLMAKYKVSAVAIAKGSADREVGRFVKNAIRKYTGQRAFYVYVNDAGAAAYAASRPAHHELPQQDEGTREAVSVARRLQDPLAELVKLDPRTIGVGQYQHDVNQRRLREGLYRTIESVVNQVGADLNTASVELLRYISGIQMGTAQNILAHRESHGPFVNREQLKEVSGIGEKTYEQCIGFLRIPSAERHLDRTAIHPEAYPVAEKLAEAAGVPIAGLFDNPAVLDKIPLDGFADGPVGLRTLADIRSEIAHPGRDPRPRFRVPRFHEAVDGIQDLNVGMEVEGWVTNITDFGAFVDIGVHQDGLIHLSELANRYVRDPHDILKVGDVVKVKIVKVDKEMRRISLSRKAVAKRPRRRPRRAEEGASRRDGEVSADAGRRQASQETGRGAREAGRQEGRRSQEGGRGRRDSGKQERGRPRADNRKGRPPRKTDSRPARTSSGGRGGAKGEQFNTLLADQLAALKDSLDK